MILVSSWDDGHPFDGRLAEMYARRGLTATFYVPLRNREGRPVMTAEEIRGLYRAGFEIGSHTAGHRYLDSLTLAEASAEVRAGKEGLEQLLGQAVPGFCYPGGRRPARARELLRAVGITHARTVENLRTDRRFDWHEIPTTLQFYPHRWPALVRNASRFPLRQLRHKLALIRRIRRYRSGLDALPDLIEARAADDCVFHLWGHSWEVEALDSWHRLGAVLDAAAACCERSVTVGQLWAAVGSASSA